MTITLDLSPELEKQLAAEASRQGVPLSEYLVRVLSNGRQQVPSIHSGAELVAYWQQADVVCGRADIRDAQQHARDLRAEAERRERP